MSLISDRVLLLEHSCTVVWISFVFSSILLTFSSATVSRCPAISGRSQHCFCAHKYFARVSKNLTEISERLIRSLCEYNSLSSSVWQERQGNAFVRWLFPVRYSAVTRKLFENVPGHWIAVAQIQIVTAHRLHWVVLECKWFQIFRFMENLQSEVLELEFIEFSKGKAVISEVDFARILLRYYVTWFAVWYTVALRPGERRDGR